MCLSFIGSMVGSCCCVSMGKSSNTTKHSRMPYIVLFVFFAALAFVFSLISDKYIRELPFYSVAECDESCARNTAIYRIGFCLTIFFAIHYITLYIPGTGHFHVFCNPLKFTVLVGVYVWSFWWDNRPMETYADTARWFSWVFLILQTFLLINWAYDTHDRMMTRMLGDDGEDAEPGLKYAYIIVCLVLVIASYVLLGFFFHEYGKGGCGSSQAFLVLTIVFGVMQMGLSYYVVHGNGFVSSVVMLYVTYLTFQAVATSTVASCNSPTWSDKAPMQTGLTILIVTLSYVGYDMRMLTKDERELVSTDEKNVEEGTADVAAYHGHPTIRKMNRFFHLVMTMGSFYLTMLMSNWGPGVQGTAWYGQPANAWINISAEWIAMVLYIWVLLAPLLLPDHEFPFATSVDSVDA